MVQTPFIRSLTENSYSSISSLPASIFEKSKISFIRPKRESALN